MDTQKLAGRASSIAVVQWSHEDWTRTSRPRLTLIAYVLNPPQRFKRPQLVTPTSTQHGVGPSCTSYSISWAVRLLPWTRLSKYWIIYGIKWKMAAYSVGYIYTAIWRVINSDGLTNGMRSIRSYLLQIQFRQAMECSQARWYFGHVLLEWTGNIPRPCNKVEHDIPTKRLTPLRRSECGDSWNGVL